MRIKRISDWHPTLWVVLTGIIFIILTVTTFIIGLTALILFHFEAFTLESRDAFFSRPLFLLAATSVIIGTVITMFMGKKILSPITELGKASREVAKGNFDVTLTQSGRILEINEMIQNFNFMVRQLSRVETLRNDFLDNVSHEFRTPISAIEGYATLLRDGSATDAEKDDYIKLIIESARQLSALSANILKLSKLENQEIVFDRKSFRLDEQIREAILFLESRWSEKELELDIDLPKTTYFGNKELLAQVWLNLLDNAIKFTPNSGGIAIGLVQEKENVIVKLKDSGRGMGQEELDHIFEKFYQGDIARKETGNGLGLALVSRIIYLCKGKIKAESVIGVGSEFTVVLPIDT